MRRVVVTGLGLVTPLADGVEKSWERILDAQSGAGPITHFDTTDVVTTYACEVPYGDGTDGTFNPDAYMAAKERRKVDDFIVFAVAAAQQAVEDLERTGVLTGSGIGGLNSIANTAIMMKEKGPRRVSPFFVPGALINLISGQIAIKYGFKGPNHAVVTACSTGAHAIGDATQLIKAGRADVMIAGGAEAAICEIGIAGFNACKALSTKRADDPKAASRPYDADRDGFVMGEGAGMVVLEDYEHAKARGAKIYAEVLGYGLTGDAYHITAPSEDGEGGERSMRMALKDTVHRRWRMLLNLALLNVFWAMLHLRLLCHLPSPRPDTFWGLLGRLRLFSLSLRSVIRWHHRRSTLIMSLSKPKSIWRQTRRLNAKSMSPCRIRLALVAPMRLSYSVRSIKCGDMSPAMR